MGGAGGARGGPQGPPALTTVGKFCAKEANFSAFSGFCWHNLVFVGIFTFLVGIFPFSVGIFPFFVGIFPFLVGKFKGRPPLENGLCTPLLIGCARAVCPRSGSSPYYNLDNGSSDIETAGPS